MADSRLLKRSGACNSYPKTEADPEQEGLWHASQLRCCSRLRSLSQSLLTPHPTAVVSMRGDLVDFTAAASTIPSPGCTMRSTPPFRYRHRRTARHKSRSAKTTPPG